MEGKKKNVNVLGTLLVDFVVCLVPFIVSAKKYQIGLSQEPWFFRADYKYDFFLYWKGQALILLCGLLAAYMAGRLFAQKSRTLGAPQVKCLIPALVYGGMVMISAWFSEHRDMAVTGGYEQWEGAVIQVCYVVLFLMACSIVRAEAEWKILLYGVLASSLVMSFLSVMQCFGRDFFRTEAGQYVMNFMSDEKLEFSFNFPPGRVYATLFNPNYVGSYVALVLPVVLSLIFGFGKKWSVLRAVLTAVSVLTAVFLVIMLAGSESVTGFIGVASSLLLLLFFLLTNIRRRPLPFLAVGGLCLAAGIVVVAMNRPVFEYAINKIFHPTPDRAVVTGMVSQAGYLEIETKAGDRLRWTAAFDGKGAFAYEAADEEGTPVPFAKDPKSGRMKFQDPRFEKIEIYDKKVSAEGGERPGFVVDTPSVGRSYTVVAERVSYSVVSQMIYRVYNPFEKLDSLRRINAFGFEDRQHFGSRRGYIWSRTIPLLKKHILLGSGPDTFVYEFPNDDYVGMKNVGYDGLIVTKPHNMFMQIFVQTGFLSLAAFLVLFGIYFAECLKLYWKKSSYSRVECWALGILLGTFGYLVTGLANDSTVAVAPVYWGLLGAGYAINRCVGERK